MSASVPEWWLSTYRDDILTLMFQDEKQKTLDPDSQNQTKIEERTAAVKLLIEWTVEKALRPIEIPGTGLTLQTDELLFLAVELMDRYRLATTTTTEVRLGTRSALAVACSVGCKFIQNEDYDCKLLTKEVESLLGVNVTGNLITAEHHFLATIGWHVPSIMLYNFVQILLITNSSSTERAKETWKHARTSLLLYSALPDSTMAAACFLGENNETTTLSDEWQDKIKQDELIKCWAHLQNCYATLISEERAKKKSKKN